MTGHPKMFCRMFLV